MREVFFILFFLIVTIEVCGQINDYEYIVTNWGDTIECDIDSIDSKYIYYWEDTGVNWIAAKIKSKYVSEIITTMNPDSTGNSKISSDENEVDHNKYDNGTINSLYFGFDAFTVSASYDALVPIADRFAYSIRAGVGFAILFDEISILVDNSILAGGPNHYIDGGFAYHLYTKTYSANLFILRAGYRYQGSTGFIFKAYPAFLFLVEPPKEGGNGFIWFGVGIGHTI